jgi:hypothetical protein
MSAGDLGSLGGTTLSAGLADAQLQQAAAISADFGGDSIAQFASAYRASGGGPTLALLGFNPFQILATGAFHYLYWSVVMIFLGITAVIAMQQSLLGRQNMRARHPLAALAQVNFRLLVGALIIANTPLLYAAVMTVNSVLAQSVQAMAAQSLGNLLQTASLGTLTFAQARAESIRGAAARRAIALYPSGASRAEMLAIGAWYNAMAAAINSGLAGQNQAGPLPVLDPSAWTNSQTPDDRLAAAIGRGVIQNFAQLVADLGALPAASGPLSIGFPSGQSQSLAPLSASLAADDAQAAAAVAMPNLPSNDASFESARQLYAKSVLTDTLSYLDTQLLPVLGASPTLSQRVQAWFSDRVERAAAAAGGFMNELRATVDWAGRGLGIVLTRLIAFFFTAAVKVLIELDLFVLVLAMPFWLLHATEEAFYGVLRSLISLSVLVPAYQFIMLFVDALMGLVLKYVMFGPLATGAGGAAQTTGGAATMVAAALVALGSGGEIIALTTFCYLVAYLFLAIYVAFKTPKLLALFLRGAGVAGAFLSTFATGLIAGASSGLATAAVAGGGGIAGSLMGIGSGQAGAWSPPFRAAYSSASGPAAGASSNPGTVRPPFGRVPAPVSSPVSPKPTGPHPAQRATGPPDSGASATGALGETLRFGVRSFIDGLEADSPGEGFKSAVQAWEQHRKQKEKAEEARYKAQAQEQKAPAHRPRQKG